MLPRDPEALVYLALLMPLWLTCLALTLALIRERRRANRAVLRYEVLRNAINATASVVSARRTTNAQPKSHHQFLTGEGFRRGSSR